MTIIFDHVTLGQRVLFGTGRARDHAVAAADGLGARRVLLIGGAFTMALSDEIAGRVPVVARIHDIEQHVPVANGRAAAEIALEVGADAVISIGGGSSTGLAKFVARESGLPIVAVPTTFAGSEATNVWGHVDGDRKVTGMDDRVLPKVIVYDADLLKGLPGSLATASGLNALAHAVDSFWAPQADPINAALGSESIRALVPGLLALAADPGDAEARERTLYGAYLAAVAFASAGSGMHHKICHALGGAFGLSHAEMHAVVLPYVVAFNQTAAPNAAARILQVLGHHFTGSPAETLYELRKAVGVVNSLSDLGLQETDVPKAASIAYGSIPTSNPRPVTMTDLEQIIHAAWAGDHIGGI